MKEDIVRRLCAEYNLPEPESITRCATGIANYVYIARCAGTKYVVRLNENKNAYRETVHWLEKLNDAGVPVPQIIGQGRCCGLEYLILTYIEGDDLGKVYSALNPENKREIARQVAAYQKMTAKIRVDVPNDWSWRAFIQYMLDRATFRISRNGFFNQERVERLRQQADRLNAYFDSVRPVAYLDDISSKNLLIHNGRVSGIIDVDWIGTGDVLTFAALTKMALVSLDYDCDYAEYLIEELQPDESQRQALLFYTLMYCVDFMGERGMSFGDKTIPVDDSVIRKYNAVYDTLWSEWCSKYGE